MEKKGFLKRSLDVIEYLGNKLPDPAVIFIIALCLTWIVSAVLAQVEFTDADPRTMVRNAAGEVTDSKPIQVRNMLTGENLTALLAGMVKIFTGFPPLGVVLVAMLGVGVAEYTGFISAGVKYLLAMTSRALITPMLIFVSMISHSAADTGYVLIIPLGGIIFAAAGRHPVAGIAAAFAGVSGAFSATFLPSSLDPLLQGFTEAAAQIINPERSVNPLCNWYFMSASCVFILLVGWFLTDRIIEPRLRSLPIDKSGGEHSSLGELTPAERKGFKWGLGSLCLLSLLLLLACLPADSPFRSANGSLTTHGAPLMDSIVPLIAIFFLVPGIVHGLIAGTIQTHRDIVTGMAKSLGLMGHYMVMAFFAAQFTYVFATSNLGALLAIKGAQLFGALNLATPVMLIGVILLTTCVNLLIGSASAKWALLAPILVPLMMQLGVSPELTQATYRIGDSSTNIITPLLPYFPLIVTYCQRYSSTTGIGTLIATMAPYSAAFLVVWTILLLVWWALGIPLGVASTYVP